MELIQIQTTTETRELAERIATSLVEQRLAACVQILGPIQSTYRWQGKIERTEEFLCLVKTSHERFPEVAAAIRDLHPYDVPEIIAIPVTDATGDYASWVRENSRG